MALAVGDHPVRRILPVGRKSVLPRPHDPLVPVPPDAGHRPPPDRGSRRTTEAHWTPARSMPARSISANNSAAPYFWPSSRSISRCGGPSSRHGLAACRLCLHPGPMPRPHRSCWMLTARRRPTHRRDTSRDDPEVSACGPSAATDSPDYSAPSGLVSYHYLANQEQTDGDYGLYRVDISPNGGGGLLWAPLPPGKRCPEAFFSVLSGTTGSFYDGNDWIDGQPPTTSCTSHPAASGGFRQRVPTRPRQSRCCHAPGAPREAYSRARPARRPDRRRVAAEWFVKNDNFFLPGVRTTTSCGDAYPAIPCVPGLSPRSVRSLGARA